MINKPINHETNQSINLFTPGNEEHNNAGETGGEGEPVQHEESPGRV